MLSNRVLMIARANRGRTGYALGRLRRAQKQLAEFHSSRMILGESFLVLIILLVFADRIRSFFLYGPSFSATHAYSRSALIHTIRILVLLANRPSLLRSTLPLPLLPLWLWIRIRICAAERPTTTSSRNGQSTPDGRIDLGRYSQIVVEKGWGERRG